MTITLELPDDEAAALEAHAAAQGLSVEDWLRRLVAQQTQKAPDEPEVGRSEQPIWEDILDSIKDIPAEEFAGLPKDGASEIEHYVYGLPKRNR